MIAGLAVDDFWREVVVHLWQTTLVLLALLLIARTMRNAPARLLNSLWWIGLAKIFMPLALFGQLGRLLVSALAVTAWTGQAIPRIFAALAGGAYYVMEPGILVMGAAPGGGAPPGPVYILVTIVWASGAAVMAARWIRKGLADRLPDARPLRRCPEDLRRRIEQVAREAAVDPADVLVPEGTGVPAVTGILRPRIVIPERTAREMEPGELRAVLLHEDAHRRRHETLRLALQRLALTVFFFYPPLWLLLREINTSAEMACDEAVIDAGTPAGTYTSAIAKTLGLGLEENLAVSVLGFGSLSPVRARLDRLERNRRYIAMKRHRLAVSAAVLLVVIVSFVPMAPLADSPPAPPAPPEAPAEPQLPEGVQTAPRLVADEVVLPEYPEAARKAGVQGRVLLEVLVKADGSATGVVVREGIPGHPELDRAAVDAVMKWEFKPATSEGVPVDMAVIVPIEFRLDDSEAGK